MALNDTLPEPLPPEPLNLAADWLAQAWRNKDQPNPNAMVLATVDADGAPSARVVLCKGIEPQPGVVRFVSNYHSRKGQALSANSRAALVFHWDHSHRQLRIEGLVQRVSAADSDSYFASRAWASQLGAHASEQKVAQLLGVLGFRRIGTLGQGFGAYQHGVAQLGGEFF